METKIKNETKTIVAKWLLFFVYTYLTTLSWIEPDILKVFNFNMYIKDGSFEEISSIVISFIYIIFYIACMLYLLLDSFKKSSIEYIKISKKIILFYILISIFSYGLVIIFNVLGFNNNSLILIPSYEDKFIFNGFIIFGFFLSIVFATINKFSINRIYLKKAIALSFFMLTVILTSTMNLNTSLINQLNQKTAMMQGQDNYENKLIGFIYYPVINKNTNILSGDLVDIIYYVNSKKNITEKDIFDIIENYYTNYINKSDFVKENFEKLYKESRVYKNEMIMEKYKYKDLALIEYYKKEGVVKTLEKIKSENYQSIISMLLNQKKYIK